MSQTNHTIAPVRKTVSVPIGQEEAFDLFTSGISTWWPLSTHSVGLERASSVSLDPVLGGSMLETLEDGSTSLWGTVIAADPPHSISVSWHAGRAATDATRLDITFVAAPDGGTVVELVHSDWEQWEDGVPMAASYDQGWDVVLGRYADAGAD